MQCPYCQEAWSCSHLLLTVDKTFRTADAGPLANAFNSRWNQTCEEGGDNFDEYEPFEQLLEEACDLADTVEEYEHEGGPGMSSDYVALYTKAPDQTAEIVAKFLTADE